MQMIASVVGTTFMDNTVTSNQTYIYQVSAMNDAGEGERSGEVNVTLTSSPSSGTSSSFLDTIEGQLAVAGLAIAGVAGAGYLLWRRRRQ
jgi:LPXTG-motif cell wall-anchored protein